MHVIDNKRKTLLQVYLHNTRILQRINMRYYTILTKYKIKFVSLRAVCCHGNEFPAANPVELSVDRSITVSKLKKKCCNCFLIL